MSGTRKCLNEVKAAHGDGGATDQDALDRLEAVDRRAGRLQRTKGLSREDAVQQAGEQLTAEEEMAAAKQKANQLMNLRKRISRREQIEDTAGVVAAQRQQGLGGAIRRALGKEQGPTVAGDLGKALQNQVVAISTPVRGGRFSAEAQWKARAKEYTGLVVELKKAGLLEPVRRGELEGQWGRELYERSKVAAGEDGTPGVTGNEQAGQIADLIHRYQTLAKERLNREGAWIGDYAGYITRTAHDPDAIRQAGLDVWKNAILPALDQERTFEAVDDPDKMLTGVYHALVTGVHLSDDGPIGFKDPAFSGPGNAAKRASAERVLHFKDAESWMGYQKQFGTGTLFEQVLGGLDRSARQEALLSRWGTNPAAEFDQDQRYLQEKFRDSDPDAVIRLNDQRKKLNTLFGMLDGKANMPANKLAAQISADIRTWKSMASLGNVAFTHLSAGVTKAAELRYQGVGFLERYGDFLTSMVRGRGRSDESRELTDLLLAGTEGMHGRILNRFTPDDTTAGTLSKIANRYFSATGLTYLLDAQKAGAMRVMSRFLGSRLDLEHDALPPETQRAFMQYGITPGEWDALRQAPDHPTIDDRQFLTPDAAYRAGAMPDVREGETRFYHGGSAPDGGGRWITPDLEYAQGYAAKGAVGKGVYYVDVKNSDPRLVKAFDDTGSDVKAPFVHFDADADLASGLKPYRENGTLTPDDADKLALKLHGYFSDVADRSIITPGIGDRQFTTFGTTPGTVLGEAMRFVGQFKTWGVAAARQGFGRELYGGQGTAGAASGVMQMAAGAAILGYMTMTLKGLAAGQNPRPPNDMKTWMPARIQGGGFGILGDYLFGEYSRMGGGIGESVLGPVLGQGLTDMMAVWNDVKQGAENMQEGRTSGHVLRDLGGDALKIGERWTPFANLFYARALTNYLFVNQLQEMMNPGYLRRHEQTVKRMTGTTYWLSPTGVQQNGLLPEVGRATGLTN